MPSMPHGKGRPIPRQSPFRGFGGWSVLEIVADYRGDTWRSVYTVRFEDAVYVLHALQLYRIITQRGMTQADTAKVLGVKQPQVSLLMRNRAGTFSVGRLMEFLTALGQDVEITVRPARARKQHGEVSVTLP